MSFLYNSSLNNLSFWYPILENAKLPTPETHIIFTNAELYKLFDGVEDIPGLNKLIEDIDYAATLVGYPCFLRSGHTSNKHQWKDSCYLTKKEDIMKNLFNIIELSAMADFPLHTFVVRKLLKTTPIFHSFNDFPVTKEVRAVAWEKMCDVYRYWPLEAFTNEDPEETKKRLDILYKFTEEEVVEVSQLIKFVSNIFPEGWCIDLLLTNEGWFIIDMSLLENSYVNKEENGLIWSIKKEG